MKVGRGRISVFRIITRRFVHSAFSGDGARRFGGRWNSPGTAMVYTAGSMSLAILEWRAHLAQWPPPAAAIIGVELETPLIWAPTKLPPNWDRIPAPKSTAAFGDDWIKSGRSAVMRVPSAIVQAEFLYLLNPAHKDFAGLVIGKAQPIKLDSRLGPIGTP